MSSPNYKVRIAAAQAMVIPHLRKQFRDDVFATTLQAYVSALLASGADTDFANFKYEDTLKHHVAAGLMRVVCLSTPRDFGRVKEFLIKHAQFLYDWLCGLQDAANAAQVTRRPASAASRSLLTSIPTYRRRRAQAPLEAQAPSTRHHPAQVLRCQHAFSLHTTSWHAPLSPSHACTRAASRPSRSLCCKSSRSVPLASS